MKDLNSVLCGEDSQPETIVDKKVISLFSNAAILQLGYYEGLLQH